jgi:hypothetical protein
VGICNLAGFPALGLGCYSAWVAIIAATVAAVAPLAVRSLRQPA